MIRYAAGQWRPAQASAKGSAIPSVTWLIVSDMRLAAISLISKSIQFILDKIKKILLEIWANMYIYENIDIPTFGQRNSVPHTYPENISLKVSTLHLEIYIREVA